jgi:flagellar hook-associated protein 2
MIWWGGLSMATVSFSGLASGIDGDAVIKALLDSRRLVEVPLQNKITNNDDENSALEEFNTRLLTLGDKLEDFLTLSGSAVSKSAKSSNDDAVQAVAGASALTSSTTIEVLKLAKYATVSFADKFTTLDQPIAPGLSAPATIDLTVGSGSSAEVVSVEIDGTTTLNELVQKINDAGDGKVQASTINMGTASDPQYILVLNGLNSGVEKGTLSVNMSPEIIAQGIFQTPTVSQAQDALVDVSGIGQVSRSSNQISDLIPGLSLELKQEGTGPVTISVAGDAEKTAMKLNDLVEAINQVISYCNDNSTIERVEDEDSVSNTFGTLARTRVDEQVVDAIKQALSGSVSTITGSEVRVFADLGVTTQRDGTLKFDKDAFIKAASKNGPAVEQILHQFADRLGTTEGVVSQYTKFQGIIERAQDANDQETESLNDRLARLERSLEQQKEMMVKIFANLESTMSQLNSTSQSLTSILSGLSSSQRK